MNTELTLLDILNVLSFVIGLINLDLNVDQNDMDAQTREISDRANALVNNAIEDIHKHLLSQDAKIDRILEVLNNENH